MTPHQCKAARALLDWSQPDLAEAAGLGLSTIVDFERTRREVSVETIEEIRGALVKAGIEFLENGGIRLKKKRKAK